MQLESNLKNHFEESANVKIKFIEENEKIFKKIIEVVYWAIDSWHTVFICGNGWSAADAQHIAAELTWRYKTERNSLPWLALTVDTSALTAIWNDYWFEYIFSRQLEWVGKEWDILIWISTSWNSWNVIEAINMAKKKWIKTIWLLGKWWWKLKDIMDYSLVVPSDNTPRIQECHMTIYHALCEQIDILDQNKNN